MIDDVAIKNPRQLTEETIRGFHQVAETAGYFYVVRTTLCAA